MLEIMDRYRRKPPYRVNLARQQSVCESNFLRIMKLLPGLGDKDDHRLTVRHGSHEVCMHVHVQERAPYTTSVKMSLNAQWDEWLPLPEMQVRLYHDVHMAEVISAQKTRRFQPVYHYPNDRMMLPDEKEQLNRFLSEWLDFCLSGGLVQEKVF